MNAYRDDVSVLVIGEPVKEYTHVLIPPHPDEASGPEWSDTAHDRYVTDP